MTEHLFALEPAAADESEFRFGHARWTTSLGALAEARLIAELLARGHRVAQPFTDDDGVDLIVNYHTCVQVKCSSLRGNETYRFNVYDWKGKKGLPEHVDVLALHAWETALWWFIPRANIDQRSRIDLAARGGQSSFDQWRNFWNVFD